MTAHPFRQVVWPFAIAETVVWASMYYLFPAMLPEWERDLGWSKTELSGAFTLSLIVSAVLAPVAGRLIDHGLSRFAFVGGAMFGVLMLVLLSEVTTLWQFYAVWLGLGVAMSFTLYDACFAVLTRAMGPYSKRAITLVTLVAGFAGTVSFPSAHALAGAFGWRAAVGLFALAIAVIAVPLIWIGCRRADRHSETHAPAASEKASQAIRAMRTMTFWMLAVAFVMIAIDHGIVITHILPLLDDRGINDEAAVLAAAMIGPMQVCGRLAMMAAERYVSIRVIAVGCYVTTALAATTLLAASVLPSLVVAFVILQGAGYGVTSIVRPVLVAELLGRRNFGVIAGMLALPFMAGYAVAPTLAAFAWQYGGYGLVLVVAIAASILGLLALVAAWRFTA